MVFPVVVNEFVRFFFMRLKIDFDDIFRSGKEQI